MTSGTFPNLIFHPKKSCEYRRTFNIGNYETVTLVSFVESNVPGVEKSAFLEAQINLIEQAQELFKCRKMAAKESFDNKLVDFCEKQEAFLKSERGRYMSELSNAFKTQTPPQNVMNASVQLAVNTTDNTAQVPVSDKMKFIDFSYQPTQTVNND